MNRYLAGIDGGGTRTRAVILEEDGRVIGSGSAGASNYDDVGIEAACASIGAALAGARQQAGLPAAIPMASVFFGMAGVTSEQDHQVMGDIAARLGFTGAHIGIDHDCRIALAGGLSGRPGIVLIAGTGSSVYGMNAAGTGWRTGGWGHLIGDEGSSYWLGVQALRLAVRAYDGRSAPSSLVAAVLSHLGIADMNAILHRIYVQPFTRTDVAALAPLIFAAHRQGDPHTGPLLAQAVADLAEMVSACARQLHFDREDICEVTLVGGLLNAGELFTQPLHRALAAAVPNVRITLPELPPVLGAALLALRQIVTVDAALVATLKAQLAYVSAG
ncbi:MAG: ATPase [Anaerolineae bacterium]|nr:ATPase [Anaerolineae bacterium]